MLVDRIIEDATGTMVRYCADCQAVITEKAKVFIAEHDLTKGKCLKCAQIEYQGRFGAEIERRLAAERVRNRPVERFLPVKLPAWFKEDEVTLCQVTRTLNISETEARNGQVLNFLKHRKVKGQRSQLAVKRDSVKALLHRLEDDPDLEQEMAPELYTKLAEQTEAIRERIEQGALD